MKSGNAYFLLPWREDKTYADISLGEGGKKKKVLKGPKNRCSPTEKTMVRKEETPDFNHA